jgi:hypothetical protein
MARSCDRPSRCQRSSSSSAMTTSGCRWFLVRETMRSSVRGSSRRLGRRDATRWSGRGRPASPVLGSSSCDDGAGRWSRPPVRPPRRRAPSQPGPARSPTDPHHRAGVRARGAAKPRGQRHLLMVRLPPGPLLATPPNGARAVIPAAVGRLVPDDSATPTTTSPIPTKSWAVGIWARTTIEAAVHHRKHPAQPRRRCRRNRRAPASSPATARARPGRTAHRQA